MPGIISTTVTGGANKALAGGVVTFVGAEYVEPILDWLVKLGSDAATGIGGIPDAAQFGIKGLGLLAIGALVVYAVPNRQAA